MLAIERRNQIANLVQQNGNVTISELTALFQVSVETIRKDLMYLEENRALMRTHGGAVRFHTAIRPLNARKREFAAEKQELCRYALRFIENGDIIAIDAGSTAVELAKLLTASFSKLTVVTHSLEIFNLLSENSGFQLILCGGSFNRTESAFTGCLTTDMIYKLHVAKSFIFASNISLHSGITEYHEDMVPIQRAYIHIADQVFILANSEKYEKSALLQTCPLDPDFFYITDSGLPAETAAQYAEQGYSIINRP